MRISTNKKIYLIVSLTVIFLILFFPFVFRFLLREWVISSVGKDAKIKSIQTNFVSYLKIEGVTVGRQRCDTLYAAYDLFSFFKSKPIIENLIIKNATIILVHDQNKWFFPGILFKKRNSGKTNAIIKRLQIDNSIFKMEPYGVIDSINISWKEKDKDFYAAVFHSKSDWGGVTGRLDLNGTFSASKDLSTFNFDSLRIIGPKHNALFYGRILPKPQKSFIAAHGDVTTPEFFSFIKPAVTVELPVAMYSQTTFLMDDMLGKQKIFFSIKSNDAVWENKTHFSVNGGASVINKNLYIDSILISTSAGKAFGMGHFDFNSKKATVNGTYLSPEISVKGKNKKLQLQGRFGFTGPTSGGILKGTLKISGKINRLEDIGIKEVGNVDFIYDRGQVTLNTQGLGSNSNVSGEYKENSSMLGETDIGNITDLLALAGINAQGKGKIYWRLANSGGELSLRASLKASNIVLNDWHLDSAKFAVSQNKDNWVLDSLLFKRDDFSLRGHGEYNDKSVLMKYNLSDNKNDSLFYGSVSIKDSISVDLFFNNLNLKKMNLLYENWPDISGEVKGSLLAKGKIDDPKWLGKVIWQNPRYKAIKLEQISTSFEFQHGKIHVDSLVLQDKSNRSIIKGNVPYPWSIQNEFDIFADLNQFPLGIIPLFVNKIYSLDGIASGRFDFKGSLKKPQLAGNIKIDTMRFNVNSTLPQIKLRNTIFNSEKNQWNFKSAGKLDTLSFYLAGSGKYGSDEEIKGSLSLDVTPKENIKFEFSNQLLKNIQYNVNINGVPVYRLHKILPFTKNIEGTINAYAKFESGNVSGTLKVYKPIFNDIAFDSAQAVFNTENNKIISDNIAFYNRNGSITANGIIDTKSFHYNFKTTASGFPVKLSFGKADFTGNIAISGIKDSINVNSQLLNIRNLEYPIPQTDQVLKVANASSNIKNNKWVISDAKGLIDKSDITINGNIDFTPRKWMIHFTADGDSIKASKGDLYKALIEKGSFDIMLLPDEKRFKISVNLAEGRYTQIIPKVLLLQPGRGIYDPEKFNQMLHTKLQIQITSSESLWIDNNIAKLRFGADLTITGNLSAPIWQGRIQAYEGEIYYLSKNLYNPFILSEGTIAFDNIEREFNPRMDIEAVQTANYYPAAATDTTEPITIRLSMHGPLKQIQTVNLTSEPDLGGDNIAMKNANILSVLATGRPLKQFFPGDFASVASLRHQAQSMFQYYLQSKTRVLAKGLHLDDVKLTGGDIFAGKAPELVLTKSVGKFNVEYSNNLDENISKSQEVKLQYKLLESIFNNLFIESTAQQASDNYGMDLKYIVRF